MRKLLLLLATILAVSATANAQDEYPRGEIYATYNLFVADIDLLDNESLHGWGFGVQGNLNKWLGLVGEYSAAHGSSGPLSVAVSGRIVLIPKVDLRERTFLFGPRVSLRTKPVTVFGHFLLGGGHLKVEDEATGFTAGNNEFAMAVGGGLDVNLSENFAIRAFQFDYLPIHSDLQLNQGGSSWSRNSRFQAGVVFKFGQ